MKIVRFADTEVVDRGNLEAREYAAGDIDMNLGVVKVKGRHPDKNYTMNTGCKELFYVLEGSGVIFVQGEEHKFDAKDEIIVDRNEPYFFEGNFTVATVSTPAWTVGQAKIVNEQGEES